MQDITGYGSAIAHAWREGMAGQLIHVRRLVWQMQEAGAYIRAVTTEQHADWYCALPWYRMWWAMVTGR